MGFSEQGVKLCQISEAGVDALVVHHVVATIGHGRRIERRYPDRIDAQPDQVVEPRTDSGEVAHTVAVRVRKGQRVDLIHHSPLPPHPPRRVEV
jgi:hypothetical protein